MHIHTSRFSGVKAVTPTTMSGTAMYTLILKASRSVPDRPRAIAINQRAFSLDSHARSLSPLEKLHRETRTCEFLSLQSPALLRVCFMYVSILYSTLRVTLSLCHSLPLSLCHSQRVSILVEDISHKGLTRINKYPSCFYFHLFYCANRLMDFE